MPFLFLIRISIKGSLVFRNNITHTSHYIPMKWHFPVPDHHRSRLILTSLSARLHHHPTSHGIKRVRNQPCYCRDSLGNHPAHYDMHILWVRQHTCHQEQTMRVNTEGKVGGKEDCGRNHHPPTPGVAQPKQQEHAYNFSLCPYLTMNRCNEWNELIWLLDFVI